jgi:hypothetical protein
MRNFGFGSAFFSDWREVGVEWREVKAEWSEVRFERHKDSVKLAEVG